MISPRITDHPGWNFSSAKVNFCSHKIMFWTFQIWSWIYYCFEKFHLISSLPESNASDSPSEEDWLSEKKNFQSSPEKTNTAAKSVCMDFEKLRQEIVTTTRLGYKTEQKSMWNEVGLDSAARAPCPRDSAYDAAGAAEPWPPGEGADLTACPPALGRQSSGTKPAHPLPNRRGNPGSPAHPPPHSLLSAFQRVSPQATGSLIWFSNNG